MPTSWRTEPVMKLTLKNPASVARPEKVPMKKRRNIWMEPIQEMALGETEGKRDEV